MLNLDCWQDSTASSFQDTPIFLEVKDNQRIFNGYGAQEACDMLVHALLHPCVPSYMIYQDPMLFDWFRDALISYHESRNDLVKSG